MVSFTKDQTYYSAVNQLVFNMVEDGTKAVLDVGCGTGALGKKLIEEKGVEQVIGIEKHPEAAREAKNNLKRVYTTDVENTRLDSFLKHFDCIVFSHILHHLKDPWTVLKVYKSYLKDDGYIIASIPNVAHLSVIQGLLHGRWEYSNGGLLDVCHMKFFTLEEQMKMFLSAGLSIKEIEEEFAGRTPENEDYVKRLKSAVEVSPTFERDTFVYVYTTKWVKYPGKGQGL